MNNVQTIFIGIGSNINPVENLKSCAEKLRALYPNITFSSVYQSKARDEEDQEDFLNAVAKIETDNSIDELYEKLLTIEEELGKNPPYDKGPRTIDLDILLSNEQPTTSNIVIPHPRMTERRFVLEPLTELDPTWEQELKNTLDQECKKLTITL